MGQPSHDEQGNCRKPVTSSGRIEMWRSVHEVASYTVSDDSVACATETRRKNYLPASIMALQSCRILVPSLLRVDVTNEDNVSNGLIAVLITGCDSNGLRLKSQVAMMVLRQPSELLLTAT